MGGLYADLTCWQSPERQNILALAPQVLILRSNLKRTMAAKKTAKKTGVTAPKETTAPVAKKATKKAAAKKAPAKKAATKAAKPAATKATAKATPDAIARAAYLNYRRRVEQGLPGDSHGDWLAAEKQLG
jgi:hypothetical protein